MEEQPYDYTWEEFAEHMQRWLAADPPQQAEFRRLYTSAAEADWKRIRLTTALACLVIHHGKLEEFHIKGGPSGGMVDPRLVGALWRCYSAAPDSESRTLIPLHGLLELARES